MCRRVKKEPKEFYNKLVNDKGTPLKQTLVMAERKKSYKYIWFLLFILVCFIYLVINTRHSLLKINSQIRAVPSQTEWYKYSTCIKKQTGNCCNLALVSFIHPPLITITIMANRGVGGDYLRYIMQQSTRVWTGTESCFISDKIHPDLYGGCAGPYHYRHYLATRFFTPQSLIKEIGYNPTHLIHLTRNPFYSLVSAYIQHLKCKDDWDCSAKINIKHFTGNYTSTWNEFAFAYAQQWELEYKYTNVFNNTLRVYYEDLTKDFVLVLEPILKFIHHDQLPSVLKSLECALENTDTTKFIQQNQIETTKIYTKELITQICKSFGPYWNENKWGANICL